jgi:cytochrome c oxidase assembly protein subunit 15
MLSRQPSRWLNRFAWFTAVATLFLICSGGMVTSKGVGLAVPDWPTTFGYNMFLFPVSRWVGGIFFEHTHRLIASTVGLLTLILAIWLWIIETRGSLRWIGSLCMLLATAVLGIRTQPAEIALGLTAVLIIFFCIARLVKRGTDLKWLGVLALGAVILQGVLGGLRVTMLKDEIGIFHACLAQAFLGLSVFIALVTTGFWRGLGGAKATKHTARVLKAAVLTTLAIYLQLALGATMRHQHRDLSILDFPTAYGSWLPDTSASTLAAINTWRDARGLSDVTAFQIWLQMAHRFGAVLISIGVITSAARIWVADPKLRVLRRLALIWLVLLVSQVTLGAWTIWSNKAADIATTHVADGAAMLSFGVVICAICARSSRVTHTTRENERPAVEAEGAMSA